MGWNVKRFDAVSLAGMVSILATLIFYVGALQCSAQTTISGAIVYEDGTSELFEQVVPDKRKINEKCNWQTVTLGGIVHTSPYSKW